MLMQPALSVTTKELPAGAWIALALILIFIFFLNLALVFALRRKNSTDGEVIERFMKSVRDPVDPEDKMRSELRERLQRLNDENDRPSADH